MNVLSSAVLGPAASVLSTICGKQADACHSDWSGDKDHYVRKGVRACLHGAFFTRGIWGFGVAQGEVPPVQDSAPARGNESVIHMLSRLNGSCP